MRQIGIGTKLVIWDHYRVGQPDEYFVADDEEGNSWHIQPEWLAGPDDAPNEPGNCK
jgi:hypothetical protein